MITLEFFPITDTDPKIIRNTHLPESVRDMTSRVLDILQNPDDPNYPHKTVETAQRLSRAATAAQVVLIA